MSRKNHIMVNGKLIQTDKRFSALKERQKAKIAEWFYEAYRKCYMESGKLPDTPVEDKILDYVFKKIEEAEIWIPDGEIHAYFHRRKRKLENRLKKEFANEFINE